MVLTRVEVLLSRVLASDSEVFVAMSLLGIIILLGGPCLPVMLLLCSWGSLYGVPTGAPTDLGCSEAATSELSCPFQVQGTGCLLFLFGTD